MVQPNLPQVVQPQVRVRFPPSPTGIPHIGNTRTALFNFLFARHRKGIFILRIEDTDQKRIVPQAREAILEILNWFGLDYDEFYVQSERLDIYKKHAKILLDKKVAYEKEGALYVRIPQGQTFSWTDAVGNKSISFKSEDVEDFVILKSDGFPTYHLANVVDDYLMEITHVIRGEEWISSTPKHLFLYQSFGWNPPVFAHLPIILGPDKTKLSKRHGAKSALDYKEEGYLREALLNYIALLGWSPGEDKEIMSIDEMTQLFDLKDVNTANPIFDVQKLLWMNGYYIRQLPVEELGSKLKDQLPKLKEVSEELLRQLINLSQTRMNTLNDFYPLIQWIIEDPKVELSQREKAIGNKFLARLSGLKDWKREEILMIMKKVMEKEKARMQTLYKIITGKEAGLPLPQTLEALGKERILARLQYVLD